MHEGVRCNEDAYLMCQRASMNDEPALSGLWARLNDSQRCAYVCEMSMRRAQAIQRGGDLSTRCGGKAF
jgi:hypothetical protein